MPRPLSRLISAIGLALVVAAAAAQAPKPPAAATLLITAEPRSAQPASALNADMIQVFQSGSAVRVLGLKPFASGQGLQLMILIDDAANPVVATQFSELRSFIEGLPSGAEAGVGYMRSGDVQVAAPISPDLARAAAALHQPLGQLGLSPSPYEAVARLAKSWPSKAPAARREILMISPGIELVGQPGPADPIMANAIAALQQAGIPVFALYTPAAGHWAHDYWRDFEGQSQLSQLADETGGESYMLGQGLQMLAGPLKDIRTKLDHQYALTFEPRPASKPGLAPIRVRTTLRDVDLLAPDQAYITTTQ